MTTNPFKRHLTRTVPAVISAVTGQVLLQAPRTPPRRTAPLITTQCDTQQAEISHQPVAMTSDGKPWVRCPDTKGIEWQHVGHANDVTGVTHLVGLLSVGNHHGQPGLGTDTAFFRLVRGLLPAHFCLAPASSATTPTSTTRRRREHRQGPTPTEPLPRGSSRPPTRAPPAAQPPLLPTRSRHPGDQTTTARIGASMTSSIRRLVLAGAGATLALGAAVAPANASAADPHLVASTSRGGACSGAASADWDRSSNAVTIKAQAHSSYLFSGCRLRVVLTWTAQGYTAGQVSHDIPTACALSDPTCPSTVYETYRQASAVALFAVPSADTLTAQLVPR